MLYTRQILILLVSLYTVRVALDVLGVEDYGVYTVVGGIVSFFSFLSGSMASAAQRFFSFALGQQDTEKLKKVFTVNWLIYAAIAIIAFVLLETFGLWFVNDQLQLPAGREAVACWLYQFSVYTFITTIITTPLISIIIAHEDMHIYAYVSVADVLMKLGVAFMLLYFPWDKLKLYGLLIFVVSVINSLMYFVVCVRKYQECQFRHFYWDKGLFHEITSFTGWTLFGQTTSVLRNQAVTILLNQVFNPIVVAARAIAMSVTGSINVFSSNFNIGLYPPIVKSYAVGDKKRMFSLVFRGSKITFFLMWVFALPIFLEMNTILGVWLKDVPVGAALFTQLALVEVLINSISLPIMTAARAAGKMKVYELALGCIQIAIFVVSWLVLILGSAAYSVFIVAIAANILMFIVRLLIVQSLIGLSLRDYCFNVLLPIGGVILVSVTFSFSIHYYLPIGFGFTCLSIMLSVIATCIIMFLCGFDRVEREEVRHTAMSWISNKFSNK